jgi:hypothetical protein
MRRFLLTLVAAGALVFSNELARPLRPPPDGTARAPAWITLLGPLRPFVGELVRLRFEATRAQQSIGGQLEEAWKVLLLEPQRAETFVDFASWFLFDAPRLAATAAERDACVRSGFEILRAGRTLHPRAARLLSAEALALDHFARRAPERLEPAGLRPGESARGRALVLLEEALALTPPDDADRFFLRLELALCIEGLLADPASDAELRARARAAAERLLREPDLDRESRESLSAALRAGGS